MKLWRVLLRRPSELDRLLLNARLPHECEALLRRVVRCTRLWPGERIDVAGELIDHMQDALATGRSPEAVVRSFGAVKPSAKLIARARRRQRHPIQKAWVCAVRIFLLAPLWLAGLYGVLIGWFWLDTPVAGGDLLQLYQDSRPAPEPGKQPWLAYAEIDLRWSDTIGELRESAEFASFKGPASDQAWWEVRGEPLSAEPGSAIDLAVRRSLRSFRAQLDTAAVYAAYRSHGWPFGLDVVQEHRDDRTRPIEERLPRARAFDGEEPVYSETMYDMLLPHLGSARHIAWLLAADAEMAFEEGDARLGLSRIDTMLAIANQIHRDDIMISQIVGTHMHVYACRVVLRMIQHGTGSVSDDQLRSLGERLADSRRELLRRDWDLQRNISIDPVERMFAPQGLGGGRLAYKGRELWSMFFFDWTTDEDAVPMIRSEQRYDLWALPITRLLVAGRSTQQRLIEAEIDLAERVSATGPSAYGELIQVDQARRELLSTRLRRWRYFPLAGAMRWTVGNVGNDFQNQCEMQAAEAVIAAELFRRNRGRWPTSWDELVPGLITEAVEDPFEPGTPLLIGTTDGGLWRLTSVGEDGDDDNGRPWPDTTRSMSGSRLAARYGPQDRQADGDWVLFPTARGD